MYSLKHISELIDVKLIGDHRKIIAGISDYLTPQPDKLIFISNKKNLNSEVLNNSGVILSSKELYDDSFSANFLISENPKLSFARLSHLFNNSSQSLFSSSSNDLLIGKNVQIGNNCFFGKNVIIEDNVIIGDNAIISHFVVIHSGSIIGDNVNIDSGSIIGSEGFGNIQDNDFNWVHINHMGNVEIRNNVSIGSNCTIDRGTISNTIIYDGVIIDNQVHIAHNVSIGEKTAIAAKVGIAGSCEIGKRNMIGGMVGIIDHIKTADDVIISATSTVNKNINKSGIYTGIMPISRHSSWKRIAFWITKLDKIIKKSNIKII